MNGMAVVAVATGAALGACARWGLSVAFNPLFPTLPLGTLLANLCGGLLMGLALGAMHAHGELSPELRLFVTTGFLGGLTTFSTFSGESASLLLRGQWGWGAVHAGVHVIGSLLATFGGLALARVLMRG